MTQTSDLTQAPKPDRPTLLARQRKTNTYQLSVILKRKATPSFPTLSSSGWAPLGRGPGGRFGLRRFRAKLTPTPFGTHRAFTHALPPSPGLRSVPFTVPPCFFPLPLK